KEITMAENDNPPKENIVPNGLSLFVGVCPALLPDEEEADYYGLFDLMSDEIAPTNNVEWFAVDTAVDILGDMSLLWVWNHAMLVIGRHRALEKALLETQNTTLPSRHPNRIAAA